MPPRSLKRPAEVKSNFRRPPEPFPQMPGASGALLAPSGMGKTTTLIAMLLGPYDGIFDRVQVFSPSVDVDSAWLPAKKRAASRPRRLLYSVLCSIGSSITPT